MSPAQGEQKEKWLLTQRPFPRAGQIKDGKKGDMEDKTTSTG